MDFLKNWVGPILIGGVIGYFTNWLAIKMLFRPLKPVVLFGFRMPFTPGILPRERDRLAVTIGESVSRELLSPELLRERLADPALAALHARLSAIPGLSADQADLSPPTPPRPPGSRPPSRPAPPRARSPAGC